ncbi:MAG: autotransporter outer membrane beta-barrel domain-containing protein [Desulfovibrio sp.]|nr:autotransporter outer membrane beta-barrel domain-containing protein [Desulfovibrio sp.]
MAFQGSPIALDTGDKVILIEVTTGALSGQQSNRTASAVPQGASLIYNFTLEASGKQLIATLASTGAAPVKVNPKTKAFSQERLAQLAFITQGADLVNQGVMNAMLGLSPDFAYDVVPFFIGQGGKSRYETGSHIDVDGMALTTGLAWRGQTTYGFPILAAFFEAGWGNFKTSLDSSHEDASGKGDLSYYGAGLLGHMDFNPLGPGSFYAEGSVRTGYSYGDFHTRNIRDGFGRTADFESSAPYYGLHVGLGYRLKFNELLGMELYSKYFWTHLAADEVNILGDPFEFDALDSQRWRNGLRLSFYIPTQNYMLQPFVGVAYEHEFAGTASGSVHGYTMEEPSIKGGSGIGEIGLSLYPTDHAGLSLDVAVSGYTGRREGVSGDIRLKWEF